MTFFFQHSTICGWIANQNCHKNNDANNNPVETQQSYTLMFYTNDSWSREKFIGLFNLNSLHMISKSEILADIWVTFVTLSIDRTHIVQSMCISVISYICNASWNERIASAMIVYREGWTWSLALKSRCATQHKSPIHSNTSKDKVQMLRSSGIPHSRD